MKLLEKILNKFRKVKVEAKQLIVLPPKQKIGYFNGLCPKCKEHIGVYVWREWFRKGLMKMVKTTVYCAVCNSEIFDAVESKVEIGRI